MNLTHLYLTLVSMISRPSPNTPHRAHRLPLHDIAPIAYHSTTSRAYAHQPHFLPLPAVRHPTTPTPPSPLALPFPTVMFALQIRTTARRLMFCGAALVGGGILYFSFSVGQDQMGPPNTGRSLGKVVGDGKRHMLQRALQHALKHALKHALRPARIAAHIEAHIVIRIAIRITALIVARISQ